jgi:hypothetical protein
MKLYIKKQAFHLIYIDRKLDRLKVFFGAANNSKLRKTILVVDDAHIRLLGRDQGGRVGEGTPG